MIRRNLPLTVIVLICLCPLACGPWLLEPSAEVGGLRSTDFEQINLNGFDPEDNAVDHNDYAWAMEYFQADGADQGFVYVATGNDMVGLMLQGMGAMVGGGQLGQVTAFPPEIRRYRPDIFPKAWERVLDYRDVETAPDFKTIGFRYMKAYRAQSNGINYLYAATFGEEATVWRSATGEPGSWAAVWTSGEIGSVRYMEEHSGILYLALANDAPVGEQIGKIYATDGAQFWAVVTDGFGDAGNTGMMSLASYNGWLYAGTMNLANGCQIWKLLGPGGNAPPVRIVANGGPSPVNESAITPCVFQGGLYWGAMIYMHSNVLKGLRAADIIRINADDTWETVVGPQSLSGFASGFNHWPNSYVWSMTVHDGWIYAGTFDQATVLASIPDRLGGMFSGNAKEMNPVEALSFAGADLFKSPDGVTWYLVTLNGFGDVGNYGFRTMKSVGSDLYIGTANPYDGLEIWLGRAR